jgi:hypothetical protein
VISRLFIASLIVLPVAAQASPQNESAPPPIVQSEGVESSRLFYGATSRWTDVSEFVGGPTFNLTWEFGRR